MGVLISDKIDKLAEGQTLPAPTPPVLDMSTKEPAQELKQEVPVSESIAAGLTKLPTFNAIASSFKPSLSEYDLLPDGEDLTKYPELYEGMNDSDKAKVLGSLSLEQAKYMSADIRERQHIEELQYANGNFVGMATEVATWFDPTIMAAEGGTLAVLGMVPKVFRLSNMAKRGLVAADMGLFAAADMEARNMGHPSADEEDVIYAGVAGLTMGGLLGTHIMKADYLRDFATHAEEGTNKAAQTMVTHMDDTLVKDAEAAAKGESGKVATENTSKFNVVDPDGAPVVEEVPKGKTMEEKLLEVGSTQRGEPEVAMTAAQKAMGGSGLLSHALEHGGDLTDTMTRGVKQWAGYHDVAKKVRTILRSLKDEYGFERELDEQLEKALERSGLTEGKFHRVINGKLRRYVEEHKKVPVYNEAQRVARQVAIDLGNKDFNSAIKNLETLQEHLGSREEWMKYAHEGLDEGVVAKDMTKQAAKDSVAINAVDDLDAKVVIRADELAENGQLIEMPKGKVGAALAKNPLITDGLALLKSASNVARMVASHVGELAIASREGISITSAITKLQHESRYLKMIPRIRTSMQEYLSEKGIKKYNIIKYHGKYGKGMFDEELALELGRRYSGKPATGEVNKFIKQAADAIDEVTHQAIKDIQEAGWQGAEQIKWKPGYFPLIWDSKKIGEAVVSGKEADVHRLLTGAYESVGMSHELSERLARAVMNRKVMQDAQLDFNPALFGGKEGEAILDNLLREAGISDLDREGIVGMFQKEKDGFHTRTDIDLGFTMDGDRVIDYIHTDVENLMARWAQEHAGKVGLARKGITSMERVASIKKMARAQAHAAGEDAEFLGKRVDAVFDTILARPVNGGVHKNVRRIMDYTMVSKLGGIAFAQTAEMGNVMAAHGVFQTLASIPEVGKTYRQLIKAAKSGDWSQVDKKFMAELQVYGGQMIDEHMLYRPSVRLDEGLDSGWSSVMDNVMATAQDKMGYMSGMYQIKGIEQTMVLMHQANKVAGLLSKKINGKTLARLNELGWDEAVVKRILKEHKKYATFNNRSLDRLNLQQWDALTREEYLAGMHRHVSQIIQRQFAGEDRFWMHNNIAAIFTQFRSYPLLALEKQTGRHMLAGDTETGLALMYGTGWSAVSGIAKAYANSLGRPDKDEYLKKQLSPESLAIKALNYNSSLGLFADLAGASGHFLGLTGNSSRGLSVEPPAISGISRMGTGLGQGVRAALWDDKTMSPNAVRNIISGLPYATLPGVVQLSNKISGLAEGD